MKIAARAAVGVLLLAVCGGALSAQATAIRFREAEYVMARRGLTPPTGLSWQRVQLPDRWRVNWPGVTGDFWYRVSFDAPQPGAEPWMVYIPRMREGGDLFVNGRLIATVREPGTGEYVRWMRPHAFLIPPGELHEGRNVVHVRVYVGGEEKVMGTLTVGPESAVRPLYESRFFLTFTLAQIISALTITVALFVIGVWIKRRMELDYLLFGLACLFWGLHTANYVIEQVPTEWWLVWRVLRYASTGGFAASITLFYLRFAGFRSRGMTRALAAYWVSGPLALALGGPEWHPFIDRFYQAGLLLMGCAMLAAAAYAAWRQRTPIAWALLICSLLGMGGSVHDYLLSQGLWVDPEGPYLLYFASVALLAAVGAQLVDRFVRSLSAVEAAGRERERAVSAERQRIMQDMHDGLGTQLLSSIAAVERGALDREGMAQVLREAVDDMRLAIDTLSPGREGLLEALGNLRYRLEPRFRAAGISLSFVRRDLPDRLDVAAEHGLQILRVLQESLTNVLKHTRAREVRVTLALENAPPRFVLEVADDGGGFDPGAAGPGRGVSGMRRRAQQIGAALDISSDAHGAHVALSYPLPPLR
jgi:signal transduction histidine kinase